MAPANPHARDRADDRAAGGRATGADPRSWHRSIAPCYTRRMRALVTGGTGFTGSHLVRRLLARGDQVRVLDAAPGLFHDELRQLGAEITLGSVTDAALVDRQVAGTDVVFHLAAAFRKINLPKREYWEVNCQGTRHVADACLRHEVRRLVYCSTQGVHGHVARPPGDESSPIAPEDYYQQTKRRSSVRWGSTALAIPVAS
jgi:nucleoside-diphosphate-sugar epimerase